MNRTDPPAPTPPAPGPDGCAAPSPAGPGARTPSSPRSCSCSPSRRGGGGRRARPPPAHRRSAAGPAALRRVRRRPAPAPPQTAPDAGAGRRGVAPTLGSSYATAGGCVLVALYGAGRYAPDTWRGRAGTAAGAAARSARSHSTACCSRAPWGRPPSAPPSWPAPGTWDGACGCVRSAPTGGAGSSRGGPPGRRRGTHPHRPRTPRRRRPPGEHDDGAGGRGSDGGRRRPARGARSDGGRGARRGRQALDELRHLLGVLRPSADRDGSARSPASPTWGRWSSRYGKRAWRCPCDAARSNRSRPAWNCRRTASCRRRSPTSLKHSGPGARAEVVVRREPSGGGLTVEVRDDGRAAPPQPGPH